MSTASQKLKLQASDGEELEVDRAAAECCVIFKDLLGDLPDATQNGEAIPVFNVNINILRKVMTWCEYHKNDPSVPTNYVSDISEWDQSYICVDQETLFEIILAANYLNIKPLLDLGCKTVANMIKGKTPEELRTIFNIENDFTPEEEEMIRRELSWANVD